MSDNNRTENVGAKTNEITLSTTSRPHYHSVNTVCSEDGYQRFGISVADVESCVAGLMVALQGFKPDIVLTSVGVTLVFLLRRFQLHLSSFFGFIENFLRSDDYKYNCGAMERLINTLYENHVARHETIKFKERKIKF